MEAVCEGKTVFGHIILKIKTSNTDDDNPLIIINKNDKTVYNCLRIDFVPKKYTFMFENTDTGKKGDVTIDITSYAGNVSTLLAYS